jgi:hypothetical protein
VFQTKLGFSKVAYYPQNLKKKRNYADKSHFWLKNLIFVEKPSKVSENLNPTTCKSARSCKNDKSRDVGFRISEGFRPRYCKKLSENLNPAT